MSNLIITLISVALIGLVSLGVLFFGGDAFKTGASDAEVARYLNESNQISGAIRYYQAENGGELPSDLQTDLVDEYLSAMPQSTSNWSIGSNVLVKTVDSASTCEKINKKGGFADTTPKDCTDPALDGETYYCCVDNT